MKYLILLMLLPIGSIAQKDTSTATKEETIGWIESKITRYFYGGSSEYYKNSIRVEGSIIYYIKDSSPWDEKQNKRLNELSEQNGSDNRYSSKPSITTIAFDLNRMTHYSLYRNEFNGQYSLSLCCDNCVENSNNGDIKYEDCIPQFFMPDMDESMFERLNRALLHLKNLLSNNNKF